MDEPLSRFEWASFRTSIGRNDAAMRLRSTERWSTSSARRYLLVFFHHSIAPRLMGIPHTGDFVPIGVLSTSPPCIHNRCPSVIISY
jgi:hypothetical protein